MSKRLALATLLATAMALPAGAAPKSKVAKLEVEPSPPAEQSEDSLGLGELMHATPQRVKARLGDPDVARMEGRGGFYTYRLPHCALFLFFHEGPKGLRVSGASTGPRKRGEPVLDVHACLASALQLPPPDIGPEH